MKFTVSGWPGGGSSSLSLLLAHAYGFKILQGGDVFRYLYKNLSAYLNDSGKDRVDAHNFVEPFYGPLHDAYIDELLTDNSIENLLIENDIASFRVGKLPQVCSIFLQTDFEVRKKRMGGDDRADDGDWLKEVDESHNAEYLKINGVGWFDLEVIENTHQLVIENSEITIAETLIEVAKFVKSFSKNPDILSKSAMLISEADELEQMFWDNGKEYIVSLLDAKNLRVSPTDVLSDVAKRFPKEINEFPKELKEIILAA